MEPLRYLNTSIKQCPLETGHAIVVLCQLLSAACDVLEWINLRSRRLARLDDKLGGIDELVHRVGSLPLPAALSVLLD